MTELIAVVGSANMDLVWSAPRIPQPGESIIGRDLAEFPGGKGANQAVAAARLGARVQFVGAVGKDSFGERLERSLAAAGVGLNYLSRMEDGTPTGTAGIFVSESGGGNSIIAGPGANGRLSPSHVGFALAMLKAPWTLCQGEVPLECIAMASQYGRFILNPAPAFVPSAEVLSRTFLITPNEHEAALITGEAVDDEAGCQRAAEWFLSRGVQHVAITLGDRGAWATGVGHVPGFAVHAVDTTGAGDCFSGATAAFLAGGLSVGEALRNAAAAAALSCTRPGAQASMPDWPTTQRLLAG